VSAAQEVMLVAQSVCSSEGDTCSLECMLLREWACGSVGTLLLNENVSYVESLQSTAFTPSLTGPVDYLFAFRHEGLGFNPHGVLTCM
jgi:hypothetical protein